MKLFPFTWAEIKQREKKPLIVFVVSACCLLAIRFLSSSALFGSSGKLFRFFGLNSLFETVQYHLKYGAHFPFWQLVYWALVTIFFYVVVPMIVVKFIFKENLREYGLKHKDLFGFFGTYALAFACLLPVIFFISYSPEFQVTYPFYVPTNPKDMFPYFFTWECLYVFQFFALEFFFRGFMVHGLKKYIGAYSIFAMMIPYCMIHFDKPLPECIASIFAGIFLGMMSYRTGSVWMGALIHTAVALSMDLLSLWHKGIVF